MKVDGHYIQRPRTKRIDMTKRIAKSLRSTSVLDEVLAELNALDVSDTAVETAFDDTCETCEVGPADEDFDDSESGEDESMILQMGDLIDYSAPRKPAKRNPVTEPTFPEMTPEQAAQVLTRGDLVQAVQIAMSILAGAKNSSDRWAAESFKALEYGIESVVRDSDKVKAKGAKKGKSKGAEWVYGSDGQPTSKQRADDLRVVKAALDELTAEDIIDLIPAEDLHRMLNHARAEGYTKALKEQRRTSSRRTF